MKVNQEPGWQSLLREIIQPHKEGDIITHEEIDEALKIKEPTMKDCKESGVSYREALKQYQFQRMALLEQLKNDLLICHKVYLDNVFGEGYRIVPSSEQTEVAYRKATRNIHQEFEDGILVMDNVKQVALNADAKAKASDLKAKFAFLQSLFENNRK